MNRRLDPDAHFIGPEEGIPEDYPEGFDPSFEESDWGPKPRPLVPGWLLLCTALVVGLGLGMVLAQVPRAWQAEMGSEQ